MASNIGYDDTPFLPGDKWRVHDGARPQPRIITPGCCGAPPSDATILFDGSCLCGWEAKAGGDAGWKLENGYMEVDAGWKLENGYMEVVPGTGNIQTKTQFGDCQLHLEFASPEVVKGDSQGRGNSGVFLMGLYEIQVLDCFDNPTYPDGTTGGIYGQYPPLVNACRKPGEWQMYDIIWEAPRFDGDKLTKPAFVTVILNGLVLHHRKELLGVTNHRVTTTYTPHPAEGPLELQDHGDLVRFRNIWYRDLKSYDE
jgi:hypothetical protein